MPADRKYIYWGESLARVASPLLSLLGGEGAAVNAIADRYAELVRRERPEFTLDEWCAICQANDGVSMMAFATHETPTLQLLGEQVADTPDWLPPETVPGDPAEVWEVNAARVNEILTGLSFGGRLAVLHVVDSVWADERTNVRAVLQEILRRE
jgi:hypothetical protein